MTDLMTSTAQHLRHRASRYRALADDAVSDRIAEKLCELAADYERDAARLEARIAKARDATRIS